MRRGASAAALTLALLIGGTAGIHASVPDGPSVAATTIIDTAERAAVRSAYKQRYLPTRSVPSGWTGSVDGCDEGTTSGAYRVAVETQIDYFRGLAGLPGIVLDPDLDAQAQAAALMMDAADALSHDPGTDWPCSTDAGREGAGHANLCLGCWSADMAGYIEDPGAGNTAVGHRRWLLYPRQTTMGIGATTSANAIHVLDTGTWGVALAKPRWVSWPPPGFLPRQHIWPRFSLSRPGADFSTATVRVTFDGTKVPAKVVSRGGPYGDPSIVIQVTLDRFAAARWSKDHVFTVTVKGIVVGGRTVDRTWRTTVFEPR
jgi:hypothetical protein